MKKLLSVILAVCCVTSVMSGCGAKKTADGEKIKISWLGYPNASLEKGSYPQKLLEEKFNIEIDPVVLDSSAYETKKSLLMAGGNIPDIIYELDPSDVQNDAKQDFLMEITYDDLKKNIPSVVKRINETEPGAWLYSYYEDRNFGIPNLYYPGKYPQVGQWRKDWLTNVGIDKTPSTIDEYHEAMYRFANNDPDGNGKKDTYGMSGDLKSYWFTFPEIFGAYGVLPFNWMEQDGKIVYGGVLDGTKQALATLAQWYKEGIIHPDFITDTTSDTSIGERFNNGEIGYMGVGGFDVANFDPDMENSRAWLVKQLNPNAEITVGINPTGPDGKTGSFAWGLGGHIIALSKNLKKDDAKVSKIYEILETMCNDQEFAAKLVTGEEGVHYKKNSDDVGGVTYIPPYDSAKERGKTFSVSTVDGSSFFNIIPILPETRELYKTNAQNEHVKNNIENNVSLNDVFMKTDVIKGADKYLGNLQMEQLQYFAKIIRGEEPVEYYDEFIKKWNENDGKVLTENANETKSVLDGILKKIK